MGLRLLLIIAACVVAGGAVLLWLRGSTPEEGNGKQRTQEVSSPPKASTEDLWSKLASTHRLTAQTIKSDAVELYASVYGTHLESDRLQQDFLQQLMRGKPAEFLQNDREAVVLAEVIGQKQVVEFRRRLSETRQAMHRLRGAAEGNAGTDFKYLAGLRFAQSMVTVEVPKGEAIANSLPFLTPLDMLTLRAIQQWLSGNAGSEYCRLNQLTVPENPADLLPFASQLSSVQSMLQETVRKELNGARLTTPEAEQSIQDLVIEFEGLLGCLSKLSPGS